MSVDSYALLRQNRKIAFLTADLPIEDLEALANAKMDPRHAALDELMDE